MAAAFPQLGKFLFLRIIWCIDILPRLKHVGFWGQAAIAVRDGLTSPSPRVDAPTLRMFREAFRSRSWIQPQPAQAQVLSESFKLWFT